MHDSHSRCRRACTQQRCNTHDMRRISWLAVLALLFAVWLPSGILAVHVPPLVLQYAPHSDLYSLADPSDVFTWSGAAVWAPAPAPSGTLLVNTMSSGALPDGVRFVPAAAGPSPSADAHSSVDRLPAIVQQSITEAGMGDFNQTNDAVSVVSVVGSSPALWALKSHADRPHVTFASPRMLCDSSLLSARTSSFVCRSIDVSHTAGGVPFSFEANVTSLVFGDMNTELEDVRAQVTVRIYTNETSEAPLDDDPLYAELLSIAYTKARTLGVQHVDLYRMRRSDAVRRSEASVAVAFMWIFILLTAGCAVFVSSVWLSWAMPLVGEKCMSTLAVLATAVAVAALYTLVGVTEGLFGFVVVLVVMIIATTCISCTYCCLRARRRERDGYSHPVGDSLTGIQRSSTTNGNSHSPATIGAVAPQPADGELCVQQPLASSRCPNPTDGRDATSSTTSSTTPTPDDKLSSSPQHRTRNGKSNHIVVAPVDDDRTLLTRSFKLAPSSSDSDYDTQMYGLGMGVIQHPFARYPAPLGSRQRLYLYRGAFAALVGAAVCVAIFGLWSVDEYEIWHRDSSSVLVEFMPQAIAKATFLVYAWEGFANRLKMNNVFFDVSTQWCGTHYSTHLRTDSIKVASLYEPFVLRYEIDMSIFEPDDWRAYDTVNDWFSRSLKNGTRSIAAPSDESVLIQAADARMMAFARMPDDSFVWIKDTEYTVRGLMGQVAYDMAEGTFEDGSMALMRLAPQDYHRFHAPVSGKVVSHYTLEGSFHSVNADGMTSANWAIYNQRVVMLLDTTGFANIGKVAYVAIGALCVGSITLFPSLGDVVHKGDTMGYFQFGGSTLAILFEAGRVQLEQDVLERSALRVETLVQMGTRLGVKAT